MDFMLMYILPALFLCTVYMQCPWDQKRVSDPLGVELETYKLSCGCWEANDWGSFEEQLKWTLMVVSCDTDSCGILPKQDQ